MADYIIPQYPIKRLRYFNNQFLNEKDFIDDQAAHLGHERAQLRALCVAGICEGLALSYPGGPTAPPTVAPGIAVDNSGRLIAIKDAVAGPAPTGLTPGEYLVHLRFNEVSSDPSANQGLAGDTRWLSQPLFGTTVKTATPPDGAVVLGTFTVTTTGQISGHSDAGRQFSGLRLPGPSTTSPPTVATLRCDATVRADGSSDGALLSGTLAIRRDLTTGLGATLTLTNGIAGAGNINASAALDLNTCDPGANAPAVRIQAIGDANSSGDLAFFTKSPGASTNVLVERLRIKSTGQAQFTGAVSAPSVSATMSTHTPVAPGNVTTADTMFTSNADNELYWRNHAGTNVKITAGSGLAGSIGGDYLAQGALVAFDDANDTFSFQQQGAPRPWARIRTGDVDIYQTAPSITTRVRLQSPASLAASYALTLPTALPAGRSPLQVDSNGQIQVGATYTTQAALALLSDGSSVTTDGTSWFFATTANQSDYVHFPLLAPVGSTIVAWTAYVRKTSTPGALTCEFVDISMLTNPPTLAAGALQSVTATGTFQLGQTGLSIPVLAGHCYEVRIKGSGTAGCIADLVQVVTG